MGLPPTNGPGAQRLTASWRQANLIVDAERTAANPCSTPYGIVATGKSTLADARSVARKCSTPYGIVATGNRVGTGIPVTAVTVLNALRHRGDRQGAEPLSCSCMYVCSTPYGIVATGKPSGSPPPPRPARAQRLTASWRQATSTSGMDRRGAACAQRLTASWRQAKQYRRPSEQASEECSTPYGIVATGNRQGQGTDQPGAVLNALRHRGDRQVAGCDKVVDVVVCSTPYGIVATGNPFGASGKEP